MDIEYENESVREMLNDFDLMKKKIGNDRARATRKRLVQLKAALKFSIYWKTGLGKPHPLAENLKGLYAITITGNVRLIVKPESESLEPEALKECDIVIIKGMMDYHGGKNEWLIP